MLDERRAVTFSCSTVLKRKLNGANADLEDQRPG
jgi:hypothetical protein